MITLCWVIALGVAFAFGSVPGLLTILALFVMDGVLELKALHRHMAAQFRHAERQIEPASEVTMPTPIASSPFTKMAYVYVAPDNGVSH